MAISNVSSGLRPGICTSTTRPQSPYNGFVIYETDTKQTLVWQGSAWVMLTDADSPPGLQLVKTVTVGAGVTSVPVTSCFSSEYDNYRIVYNGGTSNSNGEIRLTLGATISGYYSTIVYSAWSATPTALATGAVNAASFTVAGVADPDGNMLDLTIMNPFLARRTTIYGGFVGADTDRVGGYTSGFVTNTTSYTDCALVTGGGVTMTGGIIRVYGIRN